MKAMKNKGVIIAVFIFILMAGCAILGATSLAEAMPTDQEMADALAQPVVTAATEESGSIRLEWDKVEKADGYTIMRAEVGNELKVLCEGWPATHYLDDEVKLAKKYKYVVIPEYGEGRGPRSEVVKCEAFTMDIPVPYATMYIGKSSKPEVEFKGLGKVKFVSEDPAIATVKKSGKITGKSIGTTTVTATHGSRSLEVKVVVAEKAIDVSRWDYTINWDKVKKDDVKVAILKCTQGTSFKDRTFEYNYKNAKRVGIKLGAYCFSVAKSVKQAKAEAKYIIKQLHGRKLKYPIVMDFESNEVVRATDKTKRTKMVLAFRKVVEKAGYQFALYTSPYFINTYFIPDKLSNVYLWLARYNGGKTYCEYTGPGKVMMWQWGGGWVSGISVAADMNYIYPGVYQEE